MKKFTCLILIISCCLVLTSCFQVLESNDLDEYIETVNRSKCGLSSFGIDNPKYFLPSLSFLGDYNYLEGSYCWRQHDVMRGFITKELPADIALLCLKYDESTYIEAKDFMLQEIEPYNDKFYEYGNYIFYENPGLLDLNDKSSFPHWFTMACYNDEKQTLCFLGFYISISSTLYREKYKTDIENNWEDFIDEFFSEHYDFSE